MRCIRLAIVAATAGCGSGEASLAARAPTAAAPPVMAIVDAGVADTSRPVATRPDAAPPPLRTPFPPPGFHVVARAKGQVAVDAFPAPGGTIVMIGKPDDDGAYHMTGVVPWFYRIENDSLVFHPELSRGFPPLCFEPPAFLDRVKLVEASDGALWAAVNFDGMVGDDAYAVAYQRRRGGNWQRRSGPTRITERYEPSAAAAGAMVTALPAWIIEPGHVPKLLVFGAGRAPLTYPLVHPKPHETPRPTAVFGFPSGEVIVTTSVAFGNDNLVVLRYAARSATPVRQVLEGVSEEYLGVGSRIEDVTPTSFTLVTQPPDENTKGKNSAAPRPTARRYVFASGRWTPTDDPVSPAPDDETLLAPLEATTPALEERHSMRIGRDRILVAGQLGKGDNALTVLIANFPLAPFAPALDDHPPSPRTRRPGPADPWNSVEPMPRPSIVPLNRPDVDLF